MGLRIFWSWIQNTMKFNFTWRWSYWFFFFFWKTIEVVQPLLKALVSRPVCRIKKKKNNSRERFMCCKLNICWLSPRSLAVLGSWGGVSRAVNLKVVCWTFLIVLMLPSLLYVNRNACIGLTLCKGYHSLGSSEINNRVLNTKPVVFLWSYSRISHQVLQALRGLYVNVTDISLVACMFPASKTKLIFFFFF